MTKNHDPVPLGLRQTGINIAITFGRQFLAGLLQLGIILVIARTLGPSGAGGFAVAMLLPTLLSQVLNLGLVSANVYFVASRQFNAVEAWVVSRDLALVMGAIGLAFGTGLIFWAGSAVFPGVARDELLVAIIIFPPSLMIGMVSSLFHAWQDFRAFNLLTLVQPAVALTVIFPLMVVTGISLIQVLTIIVLSYLVALVTALWLLSRRMNLLASGVARSRYLRPALRYGVKVHLSNLVSFLNYRLDLFLVNLFAGPAAAGIYSVAVRLVEQLWMISQAVSTVILPHLSSLSDADKNRRELTPIIARIVLWSTMLAAGALAAIVQPLIVLLFGTGFDGAATVILVLLPGVVLFSCARVLANDLAARGLVGVNLVLALVVLAVNALANIILIPVYGAVGAAAATSFAYVFSLLLRLVLHRRISQLIWWHAIVPLPEDFRRLRNAMFRRRTA